MTKTEASSSAQVIRGLIFTSAGISGVSYQPTEHFELFVSQHERVTSLIGAEKCLTIGARLLLLLPMNEIILSLGRLQAATGDSSVVYADNNGELFLEFMLAHGWRDRRILSPQTADVVRLNRSCRVVPRDWIMAAAFLRANGLPKTHEWEAYLEGAKCWWARHLPGPLFGHATGVALFQPLPRAALARVATGFAQRSSDIELTGDEAEDVNRVQACFKQSPDLAIFDELIAFCGRVASDKQDKAVGRERIVQKILTLIPSAAKAGRGQLILLCGIKHAIQAGGVSGASWAPVTIYSYLLQDIKSLASELVRQQLDALSGEDFHVMYCKLLSAIQDSQRPKLEAFLSAFHRFLVICGFDPLPRTLSGGRHLLPPLAAIVTAIELNYAVDFVRQVAPEPRVALQATVGLLLGYWIPLRTVELWCIRIEDVHIEPPMFLSVYPRQRDGSDKSEAVRRQEDLDDIESTEMKTSLIDLMNLRRRKDIADDKDLLLGRPGYPNERYEQLLTTQLMNDALRWATGDRRASFYDLRHAVFSRRAERALLESLNGE